MLPQHDIQITFIISTYNRPLHLRCLLYSLAAQTDQRFEIIIVSNGHTYDTFTKCMEDLNIALPSKIYWVDTMMANCYASSNWAVKMQNPHGTYLCFPSEDCYYVPCFIELMLKPQTDLVYCDMVYDSRPIPASPYQYYRAVNVQPKHGFIDKAGFIIKREAFKPFPWAQSIVFADGLLIEQLVNSGVSHAKVPEVLWVHN